MMEDQKVRNFLNNTLYQPSIFKTKYWAKINDKSHGLNGIGSNKSEDFNNKVSFTWL